VRVRYVELVVGEVIAIVGGPPAARVTVSVSVRVLPDASRAVTVSTFVPGHTPVTLAVQFVVPVAVPLLPRLFTHLICVTAALLDTVPRSVKEDHIVV
jgi:hypothetical protein